MQVIPSIDIAELEDLTKQVDRLSPFYNHFQIDFADGQFVPFTTPPLADLLEKLSSFQNLVFDVHLMTSDYQRALETLSLYENNLKISKIFIHHGAKPPSELFLDTSHPHKYGLVLNPEDSVDTIKHMYDLNRIENIQIMTIHPGPQGSPFLPISLNKIDQLREAGYRKNIYLDGGINKDSLEIIKQRKNLPDFICPGSFFSHAENVQERVQYLSEVLRHESNTNQNTQDHH